MNDIMVKAREFILTNARLLERRLFEVHFECASPENVGRVVYAYQNKDCGLGHALEPDIRCSESQPYFVSIGLAAMEEAGYRDVKLATSFCRFLETVSDEKGLVPFVLETARQSPRASHMMNFIVTYGLNPTADICGLLHYQGVQDKWLSKATNTCYELLIENPPLEAHTLLCAVRLVEHIPDKKLAMNLLDKIAAVLPKARFFIPDAPVKTYGLTPLHFAPKPDSICRQLFTQDQIDGHIQDLMEKQLPDGGWPISWEAPGLASELEWRGRCTLDAICRLAAYGVICNE